MKFKPLGSTGVRVSELCFGTMSFGGDADEATVLRALQAAAPIPRERLLRLADQAYDACADFVRLATPSVRSPAPLPTTPPTASRSAVAPGHATP